MGCRGSKVRILSPRPILRVVLPRNFRAPPPPKEWINRSRRTNLSPAAEGTPQGPLAIAPEQVFRLLIEGVSDYAIFMLDPEGHVASWNPGAERLKGYTRGEILGRHFSTFYTQEAKDRGWPQHELTEAAREGRFEDEGWRVRKDGSMFW